MEDGVQLCVGNGEIEMFEMYENVAGGNRKREMERRKKGKDRRKRWREC